ncbi:MAG: GWxTD domain-containing protein, partial [Flavobacteriales bacterium]|nr:GWxTD domain-containing protein [Flavobacteriales bacterium]
VNNHSKIYAPTKSKIKPKYSVYHLTDSTSRVFFKFRTENVLFSKKPNSSIFKCDVKLVSKHYKNLEETSPLDSLYFHIEEDKDDKAFIHGSFDVKSGSMEYSVLEVTLLDKISKTENVQFVEIQKGDGNSAQNFLFTDKEGMPIMDNLNGYEEVKVYFNNPDINVLYCKLFAQEFPLALPPFSVYDYQPTELIKDTTIVLEKNNDHFSFSPRRFGLYQVSIDTSIKGGRTLLSMPNDYPNITSMDQLIPALRYITTKKEYSDLIEENSKESMDNFWMRVGSNKQKASELFRSYYRRVRDANNFFSTYTEGWKTDRGMIYIVFGSPNIVYKTRYSENWIYGEENNFMSLNFTFKKVENPLSHNDFSLNRSSIYKSSYYKAVDSWRQGRILN